jgi:hypothetical protein
LHFPTPEAVPTVSNNSPKHGRAVASLARKKANYAQQEYRKYGNLKQQTG